MSPRPVSHRDGEAKRAFRSVVAADRRVKRAEEARERSIREALAAGVSAHSLGAALNIDPATAWRRYVRSL